MGEAELKVGDNTLRTLSLAGGVMAQVAQINPQVTDAEADAYYATRPRVSQLGAWASKQSEPLESREALLTRFHELEKEYEGREVPRPPHWTGYVLSPETVEFWHLGEFRLHDRILYKLEEDGAWSKQRLNP